MADITLEFLESVGTCQEAIDAIMAQDIREETELIPLALTDDYDKFDWSEWLLIHRLKKKEQVEYYLNKLEFVLDLLIETPGKSFGYFNEVLDAKLFVKEFKKYKKGDGDKEKAKDYKERAKTYKIKEDEKHLHPILDQIVFLDDTNDNIFQVGIGYQLHQILPRELTKDEEYQLINFGVDLIKKVKDK